MKQKLISGLVISTLLVLTCTCLLKGNGKKDVQFIPMKATAYCEDRVTTSGGHTHKGMAAGKYEWLGLTAAIYEDNNGETGDFLGYFEITDTKKFTFNPDNRISIWLPDKDQCKSFGKKKVLVVLIKGVG